jgi:hypothetical protein
MFIGLGSSGFDPESASSGIGCWSERNTRFAVAQPPRPKIPAHLGCGLLWLIADANFARGVPNGIRTRERTDNKYISARLLPLSKASEVIPDYDPFA